MNYQKLCKQIKKLKRHFKVCVIGKSVLGKNIFALIKQYSPKYRYAIITASIHAREHLSADVAINLAKKLTRLKHLGYNVAIVPMLNPDGVNLCLFGSGGVPKNMRQKVLEINGYNPNFLMYKANINGVDLNNNFDANWQTKHTKINCPSSHGYYGPLPFSEPETLAIKNFTQKLNPFITISYHLKGEEIYFDFFQEQKEYLRDKKIAELFSASLGYKIVRCEKFSSGGYKDWCISALKIPALTIELGKDDFSHPYPKTQLKNIMQKNNNIFLLLKKALLLYNCGNGQPRN